jgi:aspartyl-tRNA(Asn)/glutamyl-tRNA(Gln) amidotransferase subunit A
MSEIINASLGELCEMISHRQVKVEEVIHSCLKQIDTTEPLLQSLLFVNRQKAIQQAKVLDQSGPDPEKPLWGVPVIIKDVLTTKSLPTTCASRMLQNFVPFYDAEVVRRLRDAGALILGKSNMDEFAMGSSTENSAFGPTKNPWALDRVPGGSSGGSAASTAARQTPLSIGTDTGGSIRQPAAFCGLVGLKPTYGRVSRYGLIAYGSSLDQAGPLTRTVRDAALVLQVIAGHDPKDSTSAPKDVPDYLAALKKEGGLQGVKIGVPHEYWGQGLSLEVERQCTLALETARDLGAQLVPLSLPHSPYAIAAYYIIVMAEASSNLARYDGMRFGYRDSKAQELKEMYTSSRTQGFGDEVKRRIILGTYVLSSGYYDAYYKKAAQVRRLIRQDYDQALQKCHLICAPTAPTTAFQLGEKTDDPLQMYLTDIFTNPLNLTGYPGINIPVGLGHETNMPVGLQLFGPAFGEELLFQAAQALENALPQLPVPFGLAP